MFTRKACLFLVLLLIAACTPYLYGVPQESWDRMSEPERIQAMRTYEREQQEQRRAAEERARRQALEREQERARQAARERERQERIEALHQGRGAYGELIRVRLQGGRIRIGDRHHHYQPLTFTIADSETVKIPVADYQGRAVELTASYSGGALIIEGVRFEYERRWGKGLLYADTGTSGPLALQGVDVFVEVHDRSTRYERERPRFVIVREDVPVVIREREPAPQVVIVREKEAPRPPIVIEREKPRHEPPAPRQPPPVLAERAPRSVEVVLLSGELKVRGKNQPVEKAVLRLKEGETRELVAKAGAESGTLTLRYIGGELFIDASRGKGQGGSRFGFDKEWKTGKVYRLELKGNLHLEKGTVKVTAKE
ncbi:hypothetical protein GMLC_16790 [Geomonas limicola]|uniref:Lipoprotein n=1 Tax=Geomonas limicola TaxID=2740186 RepID=A0A6V8N6X2_9BACT|nr:hypothetical protein [Geomonas limicola]GFO68100.1 hypothetical protein GMLC_16790 [Geomonas limicola]